MNINDLPPEILIEIFILLLDTKRRYRSWSDPLLLCGICKSWREIAIATPILWSSFSTVSSGKPSLSLVPLWLERSKSCPLSINLGQDHSDRPHALRYCAVFGMALAHIIRISNLSVELDRDVAKAFLSHSNAPILDDLTIKMNGAVGFETIYQIIDHLKSFVHLRRFRWECEYRDILPSFTKAQWSQLIHIDIRCPVELDMCLAVLAHCSRAETFSLSYLTVSAPATITPIYLPRLTNMKIAFGLDIICILHHLTLPALHTLHLTHDPDERFSLHAVSLEIFLRRSACRLESLTICAPFISEVVIVGYLGLGDLQHLRELYISNTFISEHAISVLRLQDPSTGDSCILPRLENLTLLRCNVPDGLTSDMISSRWNVELKGYTGVCSLKRVKITFEPTDGIFSNLHIQDACKLRTLRDSGLQIAGFCE